MLTIMTPTVASQHSLRAVASVTDPMNCNDANDGVPVGMVRLTNSVGMRGPSSQCSPRAAWAAVSRTVTYLGDPVPNLHLIVVLVLGLALEVWMIVEGVAVFRIARRVRAARRAERLTQAEAERALAGPSGATIDEDGAVHAPSRIGATMPAGGGC